MNLFHKHKWKRIVTTHAPPVTGNFELNGAGGMIERLKQGVTSILWECQDPDCQELRKEEMLGKEVK